MAPLLGSFTTTSERLVLPNHGAGAFFLGVTTANKLLMKQAAFLRRPSHKVCNIMITSHVLDTAQGMPAQGVSVSLERQTSEGAWQEVGRGVTNSNGRITEFSGPQAGEVLQAGTYRLCFATEAYFRGHGLTSFFPSVTIAFQVKSPSEHYHVPLLLSPFAYSTYRGS